MSDNGHILVVDDEQEIRTLVQDYLSGEGYRVSTAENGEEMHRILAQSPVDLVILDLMLPGQDGLSLARSLRSQSGVGIVILTGRGELVDRIIGLEMLVGGESGVRRVELAAAAEKPAARSRVRFAGWQFDLASRELTAPSGEEVRLTTGEYDLLAAFVTNANQVLSRDRLLDLARNREAGPFDRTIAVQVGRLRRKIEDDPQRPTLIKTVRGGGYMFAAVVEDVE